MSDHAVAIVCADLHLSDKAPACRAEKGEDWYGVMDRTLKEVEELRRAVGGPLLIAGDLFDRWNNPPWLVNFAIRKLPKDVIAIPGQHDIPFHNLDEMGRSSFWTLVLSGRILYPGCKRHKLTENLVVDFVPYGATAEFPVARKGITKVACVHRFIHRRKIAPFPGVGPECYAGNVIKDLHHSDIISGDNHIPFQFENNFGRVYNCGALFRRKSDERENQPSVGILFESGRVDRQPLRCAAQDKFEFEEEEAKPGDANLQPFLQELKGLQDVALDFRAMLEKAMKRLNEAEQRLLQEALEDGDSE